MARRQLGAAGVLSCAMNSVPAASCHASVRPYPDQITDSLLDPVDLFRVLYRAASTVLDTSGVHPGLYDMRSQMVAIVRQMDSGTELAGGAFPLRQGPTSHVIRTRESFFTTRWSQQGLPVQLQYATTRSGLPASAMTVPIIGPASDEVPGMIGVQSYASGASDMSVLPHTPVATVQRRS